MRIFGLGPSAFALLALAAPLAGFLTIVTLTLDSRRVSAWVSTASAGLAGLLGGAMLWIEVARPIHAEHEWKLVSYVVPQGTSAFNFELKVGVLADPLAALVVVMIAVVSFVVQWHAVGQMRGDSGYVRFFGVMSLCTFAALGLALSTNFFQLFVLWELLGVGTYLLVGHWWHDPAAASAAQKAFLWTRLGDLGLLLGICYIYFRFGTLNFQQLVPQYGGGKVGTVGLFLMAALVFAGAVGKAAQVPLHLWLPDSTDGPLPASAFIQTATMATAGVYLVARTYALFQTARGALLLVALVGAATALLGAVWALAQDDIRRLLACSTMSHLGLAFLGLGVGAYSAAILHLFAHASFKALLLIAAASLLLRMETFNIREMGGLVRRMPITAAAALVGVLAAAGLPPAGTFWSEQGMLARTVASHNLLLTALLGAALVAGAMYPVRMLLIVFGGTIARRRAFEPRRVRESPGSYINPMIVLAGLTVATAVLSLPGAARQFSDYIYTGSRPPHAALDVAALAGLLALSLIGVTIAGVLWWRPRAWMAAAWQRAPFLPAVVRQRFYLDAAASGGGTYVVLPAGRALQWIDQHLVDAFADSLGAAFLSGGDRLKRLELGARVSAHPVVLIAGVLALAAAGWLLAGRPAVRLSSFLPSGWTSW
jgi:NADH-quinone oxidoreductase subunit L